MKKQIFYFFLLLSATITAQDTLQKPQGDNIFRRMYQEMATPNMYRSASGAPGPAYYQQQADYVMQIELIEDENIIRGNETITFHNNAPETLTYLWVQLDQNRRKSCSPSHLRNSKFAEPAYTPDDFVATILKPEFDGGFNIEKVTASNGQPLPYVINQTMMRIDLPQPLPKGGKISFSIQWNYNINNYMVDDGRSGYEHFEGENNNIYVIAQFFPRMANYTDVEGWQNQQFWGNGEFSLPFGNYDVSITVPADHILEATGALQNRKEVFSKAMLERYAQAEKSFDKPVIIVTEEEARAKEKIKSTARKTWRFKAENVRDFAFSTSRKFIYDAMAVKVGSKNVMALSLYPKEGNPLWERYSTKTVAHTLQSYSSFTFDYPYPKAVSVSAENQGMEYPMICWNHGRADANGDFSDEVKFGMIGVIIHEVGHNFFPMIVNSDERQWAWLDEGLNSFLESLTKQSYAEKFPADVAPYKHFPDTRSTPAELIDYMKLEPSYKAPIMSNPENVMMLGYEAYFKPAVGLRILRETIMGKELFDFAFKTYARRWMFKQPTPDDFFRTMSDASAVELDWFWRTWFYSTDNVDLSIKEVKLYQVSSEPNDEIKKMLAERGWKIENLRPLVFLTTTTDEAYNKENHEKNPMEISEVLSEHIAFKVPLSQQMELKQGNYLYEVTFERLGGVPMPILLRINYADGTHEMKNFPVQVWRKNDREFSYLFVSEQAIDSMIIDPDQITTDIDTENNFYQFPKN
ncbi:MAG: M1 family metallopeptidase [Capnocytophaga sp.]|nr:M1 family metallopeptidase [Capnocytophaga sp.]